MSQAHPNALFHYYGHECEMREELDQVLVFYPGTSLYARIKRQIIRWITISETNKQSIKYLRSQGAIANEKYRQMKYHPYIIHPFSRVREWWEGVMIVTFLLYFSLSPMECVHDIFNFNFDHSTIEFAVDAVRCICLVDIYMNMSTDAIVQHFPGYDRVSKYEPLIALQVSKIIRIKTFLNYCDQFFENFKINFSVHRIAMTIICVFLYIHHMFVIMAFISAVDDTKYPSVLLEKDNYIGNYYLLIIIISVTGSAGREPKRMYESIFIVYAWLQSRILFVLVVVYFKQAIKSHNAAQKKYTRMMQQFTEFMHHRQLPTYMRERLITYFEYRFQKSYFREHEILSTISGHLRQDIVMRSCRKLVENVSFFKNLPINLMIRIVSCLRSEVYLTNDVIIKANTPGDSMYFIASGTVAIYTSSGKEICHLEDGAHFGEIALVMDDELRVASVIAVEVCELYQLARKDFMRAISPYPDLMDNIQRVAAMRMERTTMLDEFNRRELGGRKQTIS